MVRFDHLLATVGAIMKRTQLAVAISLAAVALTGCGGPSQTSGLDLPEYQGAATATATAQSPHDLLAAAQAAIAKADSVTVTGGTTSAAGALSADLALSGPNGSGTYSLGAGTFAILVVDGQAWWKGDARAYAGFDYDVAVVTRKIDDRWIVAGSSHPRLTPIQVPTTREQLLAAFVDPGPEVTATAATTIGGTRAIGLAGQTATLYVAADTKRPIRLVLRGDAGDGIQFSYDPVPAPSAPPADRIVDLSDLH
jgi:hypothetical protein